MKDAHTHTKLINTHRSIDPFLSVGRNKSKISLFVWWDNDEKEK